MKTPHANAAQIAEIIQSVPPFLLAQMGQAYSLVNTDGQQQEILDALPDFGVAPAQALALYATMHAALSSLGLSGNLLAPNLEIFQAQPDGSVQFVPPSPEPEPEP
jgi:hypothetical protein